MTAWTFDVSSGRVGLDPLQPHWDQLARRSAQLAFHQCAAWARAYLDHLAPSADALLWVTARRDGALVLVLPLERVGRDLRLLRHDHMVLADVLAPDCDAALWSQLWNWLSCSPQGPGCRRLLLPALTQDSTLAGWLRAFPPTLALCRDLDGAAWLDVDRPYDELLKAASANHRSNLTRGRKRAAGHGLLRYAHHAGADRVAAAMNDFLAVEASGWKGRSGSAVACRSELKGFYAQLGAAMGSADAALVRCEIDLLWLGEQAIAAVFWLRSGATLHLQKIAYREELGELGPGRLILAEALQRACADPGLKRLSFITRCPWADGWRTQIMPVQSWEIRPDSGRGRLGHARAAALQALKRRLRPWLRRWRGQEPGQMGSAVLP